MLYQLTLICRPLAYSTLADLLHHVREKLTMPQLFMALHIFQCNMLDDTLPTQIQTMSCKLLLNLVQILAPKVEAQSSSREHLLYIFKTFVTKLESLATVKIPRMLDLAAKKEAEAKRKKAQESKKAEETKSKVMPNFCLCVLVLKSIVG